MASSISTVTSSAPPILSPRGRTIRKSAKAAAAFVAAAVREEMSYPDLEGGGKKSKPSPPKRSYSRSISQSSALSSGGASATSSVSLHHSGQSTNRGRGIGALSSKKKTALSSFAVEYLKAWMMSPDHIEHPYPSEDEKSRIMSDTGIELKQLTNWFVNNRKRYWRPKVDEMREISERRHVTLQEVAASAQQEQNGGSEMSLVAMAHANSSSAAAVSTSEGEESSSSFHHQTNNIKKKKKATTTNSKKRKKYSLEDDPAALSRPSPQVVSQILGAKGRATNARRAKKAKKEQSSNNKTGKTEYVSRPGIHTANDHESVKAARKLKRITVSETESSEDEGTKNNTKKFRGQGKVVVSNPLANNNVTTPPSPQVLSIPPNTIQLEPLTTLNQVADLDYSIAPFAGSDDDLVENVLGGGLIATVTTAASTSDPVCQPATNAVSASIPTILCGGIIPHNCNLADPSGKVRGNSQLLHTIFLSRAYQINPI